MCQWLIDCTIVVFYAMLDHDNLGAKSDSYEKKHPEHPKCPTPPSPENIFLGGLYNQSYSIAMESSSTQTQFTNTI